MTRTDPVWIDIWLPAGDLLWRDDVGRSFDWLGDAWVEALDQRGISGLAAHRDGYLACTPWSAMVCFGGVGSGEVVTADGRKVVGLAQRRNRSGAWFHGACVLHWEPAAACVDVLALSAPERDARRRPAWVAAVAGVSATPVARRPADPSRRWSVADADPVGPSSALGRPALGPRRLPRPARFVPATHHRALPRPPRPTGPFGGAHLATARRPGRHPTASRPVLTARAPTRGSAI